jgi:hypothetical protein
VESLLLAAILQGPERPLLGSLTEVGTKFGTRRSWAGRSIEEVRPFATQELADVFDLELAELPALTAQLVS